MQTYAPRMGDIEVIDSALRRLLTKSTAKRHKTDPAATGKTPVAAFCELAGFTTRAFVFCGSQLDA